MTAPPPPPAPRRIVIRNDGEGVSRVFAQEEIEMVKLSERSESRKGMVWATHDGFPIDVMAEGDGAKKPPESVVTPNGTNVCYVDFPPAGQSPMHFTDSIDYAIVVKGEIDVELTDGSRSRIKQGDAIVQLGTAHKWSNPSADQWTRIMFIVIAAKPVTIKGKPLSGLKL